MRHWHKWDERGICVNREFGICSARRCIGIVVQFRRGRPLEIRCKAAEELDTGANVFDKLCTRCRRLQKEIAEEGFAPFTRAIGEAC